MYKPWIGKNYDETRLLILGESAYSWRDDEDDELRHPSVEHSKETVEWAIKNFESSRGFLKAVSRSLVGNKKADHDNLQAAWNKIAFTNFVEGTVGEGARTRPVGAMWAEARTKFKEDLSRFFATEPVPTRILVLEKKAWASMPDCDQYITDDFQQYILGNQKIDCFALRHPSAGLGWELLSGSLNYICPAVFGIVSKP